jgi:3-phenylpropionate/trans-cinnamate dioxygenase ferredoxin reductase subunit
VDFRHCRRWYLPRDPAGRKRGRGSDNGIVTDAYGTSDPLHIWAAGDCATLIGTATNPPRKCGQRDQAEIVVRRRFGDAHQIYVPKPWFWSDQFDTKLQIAGLKHRITRRYYHA